MNISLILDYNYHTPFQYAIKSDHIYVIIILRNKILMQVTNYNVCISTDGHTHDSLITITSTCTCLRCDIAI